MADFRLVVVAGLETAIWVDPDTASRAGRIGEVPVAPHRRFRKSARYVEIRAILDGEEESQPDAELDGRLFTAWWAEAPDGGPPISSPFGSSSVMRTFPNARGHYTLCVRHRGGGGRLLHFDVDTRIS